MKNNFADGYVIIFLIKKKLLKIKTAGWDDSNADQYHHPYEPTPYLVLERLASTGVIRKGNTLLDYACGKGRVDYFLSYQTKCHSIGDEYISYLMTIDEMMFADEIDCRDLFPGNDPREKIVIFEINI